MSHEVNNKTSQKFLIKKKEKKKKLLTFDG